MTKGAQGVSIKNFAGTRKLQLGLNRVVTPTNMDGDIGSLMRSAHAERAFTVRAGCEYWRFVIRHLRSPNHTEMDRILSNGLNSVAKRLYEWRTGVDGASGLILAAGKQSQLRDGVIDLYQAACCRERVLRERCFPSKQLPIIYFKPFFHEKKRERLD